MKGHTEQGKSHSRNRKDYDRYQDLVAFLTPEEKSALKELGHYLTRHRVPPSGGLRLVSLGLAKLSYGQLVLTDAGRRALAAILGRSRIP